MARLLLICIVSATMMTGCTVYRYDYEDPKENPSGGGIFTGKKGYWEYKR